ncbi:hypothetical protein ACN47E_006876 [Coniothyrium glycines]
MEKVLQAAANFQQHASITQLGTTQSVSMPLILKTPSRKKLASHAGYLTACNHTRTHSVTRPAPESLTHEAHGPVVRLQIMTHYSLISTILRYIGQPDSIVSPPPRTPMAIRHTNLTQPLGKTGREKIRGESPSLG